MLFSRSLYAGGETDRQIGGSWTQCSEYYNRGRYGSCAEMTPILRELKAAKIIPAMVSGRIKGPKARKGPAFLETASGAVCLEGGEGDQSGRWEGPDHGGAQPVPPGPTQHAPGFCPAGREGVRKQTGLLRG